MRIIIEPPAQRQLEELLAWWFENRPAARNHLKRELERVLDLLSAHPALGRPYEPYAGVRTYLLRKTPYHVFYRVDQERRTLHVLAVWSTQRGDGPNLG